MAIAPRLVALDEAVMKSIGTFAALASLVVVLAGCASVSDQDVVESGASEEALTSRPVTAAECKALQNRNPVTETKTLSTGDVVGLPLRACDMNVAAIFGTIDLSFAKAALAGTGLVPLEVRRFGQPTTGLVRLYIVDYLDMDLGPYKEFVVLVDGADESAPADAKKLNWVNPMSTVLPAFDPKSRTLFHQLVLTKTATKAIAYGRELLGADKRAGAVDIGYGPGDNFNIAVSDEKGAGVIRASLRPDMSFFTLAGTVTKVLGAAVGELTMPNDLAFKLNLLQLNQPIGLSGVTVGRDLQDGDLVRTRTDFVYLPSLNEASAKTMDFAADRASALGKQLSDAHFKPTSFITAKHASGVWTVL